MIQWEIDLYMRTEESVCVRVLNLLMDTPGIGVRDGGSIRALVYNIYSGKIQHICLTNCVTPNATSIHLPEIHFGWGNKGDVHRVLLYDRQKVGNAIVHYYFFLPGGAA